VEIERQLKVLPTADVAGVAWRDYGEIILVSSRDEAVKEADSIAAEHVEILCAEPRFFLERMTNYGRALPRPRDQRLLRRQGDRHQPHAAHARRCALTRRPVGRQVPQDLHYQEITKEASVAVGEYCSRLCAIERFWGHKEQGRPAPAALRRPEVKKGSGPIFRRVEMGPDPFL